MIRNLKKVVQLKYFYVLLLAIIVVGCTSSEKETLEKVTRIDYVSFTTRDTIVVEGERLQKFFLNCHEIQGPYKFPATGFLMLLDNDEIVKDSIRTNGSIMGPLEGKYYQIVLPR